MSDSTQIYSTSKGILLARYIKNTSKIKMFQMKTTANHHKSLTSYLKTLYFKYFLKFS